MLYPAIRDSQGLCVWSWRPAGNNEWEIILPRPLLPKIAFSTSSPGKRNERGKRGMQQRDWFQLLSPGENGSGTIPKAAGAAGRGLEHSPVTSDYSKIKGKKGIFEENNLYVAEVKLQGISVSQPVWSAPELLSRITSGMGRDGDWSLVWEENSNPSCQCFAGVFYWVFLKGKKCIYKENTQGWAMDGVWRNLL